MFDESSFTICRLLSDQNEDIFNRLYDENRIEMYTRGTSPGPGTVTYYRIDRYLHVDYEISFKT